MLRAAEGGGLRETERGEKGCAHERTSCVWGGRERERGGGGGGERESVCVSD